MLSVFHTMKGSSMAALEACTVTGYQFPMCLQKVTLRQQIPLPTWQEQGLCIGNSFWITGHNGLDICRRLNLLGYCRCTDLLSEVIEETVLDSGGEVIARESRTSRYVAGSIAAL